MKMLMSIDLFLWNHFVPKINDDFFRKKFNSVLIMLYISLFKLPRKFLLNYFRGKGKIMVLDTRELITQNNEVLLKLKKSLQRCIEKGQKIGSLDICQTDVYNPNYKYSVGSFTINYSVKNELVKINIHSNYHFQESPERVTKYLHHWLFMLKNKGKTNDFEITGDNWTVCLKELTSIKTEERDKIKPRLKVLV